MGERTARIQATRERIVEAAIELYTELGVSATTMRQIGERADVAPGTLRNHFATRDDLDRAMVERLTAEIPLPDLSLYDGATSIDERLRRLIRATGTFLDQARRLYRMWLREPLLSGPWAEAGATYGARWDDLMRTALGPLADDGDATAVLRAVSEPTFWDHLRGGTRTTDEACALITAVIVPWFAFREANRSRG
ncbi:MAG: TetR/AcrR family transcriptional regulator [Chloroflexota bacterium]